MAECESVRESREASGFSRVELTGTGTVRVQLGSEESLTVEAEPSMMERITSRVEDGVLKLGLTKGSWLRSLKCDGIIFEVAAQELDGLALSGSGRIEAGRLEAQRMELGLRGEGLIRIEELLAEELNALVTGEGRLELSGRLDTQSLSISGQGVYDAEGLESREASIVISGQGDVAVDVSDTLDVTITGQGNVVCHGEATVFRRVTGEGKVTCACSEDDSCAAGEDSQS